jgi:hypothetical protein
MRTWRRGLGLAAGVALTSTIFAFFDFSKVLSAAMLVGSGFLAVVAWQSL